MREKFLVLLISIYCILAGSAKADFNGATYTMNSPYSLYITNGNVTISQVTAGSVNFATLIISNSGLSNIKVDWTAPGVAIGLETTNQLVLPGGKIVEISVNAVFPGLVTYSTQLEYAMPVIPPPPVAGADIIPDLLYYKMTEGFTQSNPPVYLTDSSTHGGTTGTVNSGYVIAWVTNAASQPQTAIHFNGANTELDTSNSTLFNFTTNLFSINIWARPLILNTQPVLIGNGSYLGTGWYVCVNPAGEAGIAANSPGSSTYVATTVPATTIGQWSMLTFVRTSTTGVSIYANGVLLPTTGSFANPAPCTDSLMMGAYHGADLILDGDIGTVRVYGRVLATNEISTLYYNGINGLIP
jgi:Concanavalin A-like lectin/glucanases superfamily